MSYLSPILESLAQRVSTLGDDDVFDRSGGILTDTTFYWVPDGRVEYLARRSMLIDGEPTVTVLPGPAFVDFVMSSSTN